MSRCTEGTAITAKRRFAAMTDGPGLDRNSRERTIEVRPDGVSQETDLSGSNADQMDAALAMLMQQGESAEAVGTVPQDRSSGRLLYWLERRPLLACK